MHVPLPSFLSAWASMKFSVAPQSSSASTLVFLCHMHRSMGTVIESSLILYMELISALSTTVRTRHFKNPPLPYRVRRGRLLVLLRSYSSRLLRSVVLWRVEVSDFRLCPVRFWRGWCRWWGLFYWEVGWGCFVRPLLGRTSPYVLVGGSGSIGLRPRVSFVPRR